MNPKPQSLRAINLICQSIINKRSLVYWAKFKNGQLSTNLQALLDCLSEIFVNQQNFCYCSVFMLQFVVQIIVTIKIQMIKQNISQQQAFVYKKSLSLIYQNKDKIKNKRLIKALSQTFEILQYPQILPQKQQHIKELIGQLGLCTSIVQKIHSLSNNKQQLLKPGDDDLINRYQTFQDLEFDRQIQQKIQRLFDSTLNIFQTQRVSKSMQLEYSNNNFQVKVNRNLYIATFKRLKEKILITRNFRLLQKLCQVVKIIFQNTESLGYGKNVKQEHIFNQLFNINDISYFSQLLLKSKEAQITTAFPRQCPTVEKYLLRQNILNILPVIFSDYRQFSNKQVEQANNLSLLLSPCNKFKNKHQVISQRLIKKALQCRDKKIFIYLQHNLARVSFCILNHFSSKSGFDVKNKSNEFKRKNGNDQSCMFNNNFTEQADQFIFDPLYFLMIKKQYWEDQFNAQVLSISLWIIAQFWLILIKRKRQLSNASHQQISKQIEEYQKLQNLTISQFILSLPLKQNNTVLNYYFSDSKILKQICSISSFATLTLDSSSICDISWNRSLLEQLTRIVFQQNGYFFALKFYKSKRSFGNYIFELITNSVLQQLKHQKYMSSKRKEQILFTLNSLLKERPIQKIQMKLKIQQLLLAFTTLK